jgi:PAS domain S-box-containing protein
MDEEGGCIGLIGTVVKILTAVDEQADPYGRVLAAIAGEVGADLAFAKRNAEEGGFAADQYLSDMPASGIPEETIRERNRRISLLKAAFSIDHAAAAASEARKRIRAEGWAIVKSVGGKAAGGPGYLLALANNDGALSKDRIPVIDAALGIVEPILETRIALAKQEAERRRAERELRAGEEELRGFFEASRDMIYTSNAEDRIASVNKAGLDLLGLDNRFDAIGRPFGEFALNREDRMHFLDRIRKYGFVRDYEIVLMKAGTPIFCLETANAVLRPDGSIAAVQGIVKDISERIRNEKAIWTANLELAEANERLKETQSILVQQEKLASIGQLAAGIAHEINNPLGFMKSNFETAMRYFKALARAWQAARDALVPETASAIAEKEDIDFIAEDMLKLFKETADGYARIIEIVGQLKSFSREDAEHKRVPYDIERGLDSSLVIAWNELKYVAEVKKEYAGVGPVEAEGSSINQVLLNIIINAAQAIASQKREGKGLLTIATRADEKNVYCTISDDGPGIPREIQNRVFDPFFTTKEPGKGTGLGLSISYDIIVNKHGGRLLLASEPGAGATFEISLPKKTLPPR